MPIKPIDLSEKMNFKDYDNRNRVKVVLFYVRYREFISI